MLLSWNFAYDFVYCTTYQLSVSSICVNFLLVMPLLELWILEIQLSALFSYMFWRIELKFCIQICFTVPQIKSECGEFASIFMRVMPLLELRILEILSFPHFYSYMLWHIELKFCIWLCFTVLQIKLQCRQFASICVRVMPLLELRILKIHSCPHFSLTCFDMLSWKFAYKFILLYYRLSFSVVNLRQFLCELYFFWNLEYSK